MSHTKNVNRDNTTTVGTNIELILSANDWIGGVLYCAAWIRFKIWCRAVLVPVFVAREKARPVSAT